MQINEIKIDMITVKIDTEIIQSMVINTVSHFPLSLVF